MTIDERHEVIRECIGVLKDVAEKEKFYYMGDEPPLASYLIALEKIIKNETLSTLKNSR